ncbi:membrane-associated protein [Chitinivorax tropicus]|uniref:Membrane-associated protein n=1 Tax=Chitinivorax tropicus TaxID=714531 RepID=A0A840MVA1_9PROT|nr:DedA family protein [Chitinivorax tropicus]MBB5020276.1 membrane-associated protein [Chitinivorax tropicus]
MEIIKFLIDFILHVDQHLLELTQQYGTWVYGILFLIIFCETGLVVTPFLPGDSLLFVAGALASQGAMNVHLLAALLIVAAILGDTVNYAIGRRFGHILTGPNAKLIKKEYLDKTHAFFEKYGGRTIIVARFVPIVRTFAPFVAGIGEMSYSKFIAYNVIGAAVWVLAFVYGGFFFGSLPIVQQNLKLIMVAIIIISVMPIVIEWIRHRQAAKRAA